MRKSSSILSIWLVAAVLAGFAGPARADLFDDALLTYRQGHNADAFVMFEKLARTGDARAQFWIGTMWYHGKGKPQNYREAFRWYLRSGFQGNADAQNNLGLIYQKGDAQPANPVVAYAWFSLAAAQGNDVASSNLDDLTATLKEGHQDRKIIEGQALAQEYSARIDAARRVPGYAIAGVMATSPAPVPPSAPPVTIARPLAEAQDIYVVQIGLFEQPANIRRIRATLQRHGVAAEDAKVEIRGRQYQRFRLGPYSTTAAAQQAARWVNQVFKVQSAVIPLLR